jgi:DNA processing protein
VSFVAREITFSSADYPGSFRDLAKPPAVLHVTGELPRGASAAIVGTRHPTAAAEKFAFELGRGLAEAGVVVISGGAEGIDAAAHRGALAGRGFTVVVAPSSFDRPYPEKNGPLFREIVEAGGAFLSVYPPGTKAHLHHFFERNTLLAALAGALVVVETRYRGGARNAANAARRLGRRVLAVPGAPWDPSAAGCLLELRNGAGMAASVGDVLGAMGRPAPSRPASPSTAASGPRPASGRGSSGDPDREAVLEALEKGRLDLDAICRVTGLGVARLQALLLTLTLEGIVVSGPSGHISLINV